MCISDIWINGVNGYQYLLDKNIPVNDFDKRFKRMRSNTKKTGKMSDLKLFLYIEEHFYKPKKCGVKPVIYVGDDTLTEYAKKNRVIKQSLGRSIRKGQAKNPNADTKELADSFVIKSRNHITYTCDRRPLVVVCKELGICPETIRKTIKESYPREELLAMSPIELDRICTDVVNTMAPRLILRREGKRHGQKN